MKVFTIIYTFIAVLVIFISGCASTIPKEIREAPLNNPMVAEVRTNAELFIGSRVRWGGTIASVVNLPNETWIEIVARDLGQYGKPVHNDHSAGRFIASVDGFLEPIVYAKGRSITVVGVVEKEIIRKISEFDYKFPLVRVNNFKLWEKYQEYPYYRPYWHYDPWYPNFYPYRYYPYW